MRARVSLKTIQETFAGTARKAWLDARTGCRSVRNRLQGLPALRVGDKGKPRSFEFGKNGVWLWFGRFRISCAQTSEDAENETEAVILNHYDRFPWNLSLFIITGILKRMSEPVLISAIVFPDSKIRDFDSGKLSLVGIFHRFLASEVPFKSPPFFATAFFTNFRGQIKNLDVSLAVKDREGRVMAKTDGHVGANSQTSLRDIAEISFPVPPIGFSAAGSFDAVVSIDGEQIGRRAFNVVVKDV